MSSETRCRQVAILGVGLIGGSLGMALRAAGGWPVIGWDRDDSAIRLGIQLGAIDAGAESAAVAAAGADLVVLATPVSATIPLLESLVPFLSPHTVVTDVGSTKARVVTSADILIPGRFIGGHPMAGSARSTVASASADLFKSAPWFLTPSVHTQPDTLALLRRMAESCHATVRLCDPEEHDRLVAYLSHLPHLLAYGLAQIGADSVSLDWRDAAAGSFRDGIRVASSSPDLWADILIDNRSAVMSALAAHSLWMEKVKIALEYRDSARLRELLADAAAAKSSFPAEERLDD